MTKSEANEVFSICCRPLVEAFRHTPEAPTDTRLVIYFGECGAPFYRFARMHGGQLLSAPAEPLVFCPFCGHKLIGPDEPRRPAALAAEFYGMEESLLTLELEVETLVAARMRDSGEHAASL
jgi:hypothetical protein